MGGQACVFYGAAQFSKDVDLVLLASEDNYSRFLCAMKELSATRIAVPKFDPTLLARGHAVHFRCQDGDLKGLRIDVMSRLRDLASFEVLWARRTTITDPGGDAFDLIAIEDLVQAKKTQRERDWPMIDALVESHYRSLGKEPTPERIKFWLLEARTPERLLNLVRQFPGDAQALTDERPLLHLAMEGQAEHLREALDAEVRGEQTKDRAYWAPLKSELEGFRRAERAG
jgi:hypothetical protein